MFSSLNLTDFMKQSKIQVPISQVNRGISRDISNPSNQRKCPIGFYIPVHQEQPKRNPAIQNRMSKEENKGVIVAKRVKFSNSAKAE